MCEGFLMKYKIDSPSFFSKFVYVLLSLSMRDHCANTGEGQVLNWGFSMLIANYIYTFFHAHNSQQRLCHKLSLPHTYTVCLNSRVKFSHSFPCEGVLRDYSYLISRIIHKIFAEAREIKSPVKTTSYVA